MSDILHAIWLPGPARLFLWSETAEPRRVRASDPPLHPFAAADTTTTARLKELSFESSKAERLPLWLPTAGGRPVPSPELQATGVAPGDGTATLERWLVPGRTISLDQAIDLLVRLPVSDELGASVRALRVVVLLALELVAGQRVLPTLSREGDRLRAGWRPRLDGPLSARVAALTKALPPLCRAAVEDPTQAPVARDLVDGLITAIIDRVIRTLPARPISQPSTPAGRWLAALTGKDPVLKIGSFEADTLYAAWQRWSGQDRAAGDDVFRITFRLEPPQTPKEKWQLAYLLQATDDPSLILPASDVWREKGTALTYLNRRFDQPQEKLLAGLGQAARLFPPVATSLKQKAPDHAKLAADEAFAFLKEAAPLFELQGYGVLIPGWWTGKGARVQARARMRAKSRPNERGRLNFSEIINFQWELTLAGESIDPAEFQRLAALKQPLVQIRGQWVVLDPAQIDRALKLLAQGGDLSLADAIRLGLDSEGTVDGIERGEAVADGWLAEILAGLRDNATIELVPAPPDLGGTLRPYQQRGYSWLRFLRRYGLGACLADDMGLGKTIQTIALLLAEQEPGKPSLLVCPTSVVGNWQRELDRFAPSLKVLVHRGTERQRGGAFALAAGEHDLVLTSYQLLLRDQELLAETDWATVVLDEAQNVKNPSAKQSQAARALKAGSKIALTGTPVENRLSDLWSIMAFLNPGFLGSESKFQQEIARPIERVGDPGATARLKQLTGPFILRRLKTDPTIISDLPEKLEMPVYCPLTTEQATLYEAVVREELRRIEEATDGINRRGAVLAMLTKLKQVCNHPAQFLKDGSALTGRSGKLDRLTEMLDEALQAGDAALVFSQFAEMGGMLQKALGQALGDEVIFLHGATPARERDHLVQRFQAPHGPKVFILSLKAGGTGLNLTRANRVFHFDRWWNPAVENQATDRAFRIGQTRTVQVHKLICTGTLEDRINDLIESKRALADSVLGAGESWLTELSTDQLRDLVKLRREDG